MNEYILIYYGWIPGYNDFDMDEATIMADNPIEALKKFWDDPMHKFVKNGPSIEYINGEATTKEFKEQYN